MRAGWSLPIVINAGLAKLHYNKAMPLMLGLPESLN